MLFHNEAAFQLLNNSGVVYDAVIKFRADILHKSLPHISFPLKHGWLYVPIGKDPGDPNWANGASAVAEAAVR